MAYLKRLRARNLFVAAAFALAAAGCSMHPLPENVSRASTYDIVARVRCEVWEALQEFETLENDRERRHAKRIIQFSAIGFDFIFDITESNNIKGPGDKAGANLFYTREAFKGKEKGLFFDLTATAERERKNTRRFRIVEDLKELNSPDIDCTQATTRANWIYPVTGATGMGEVVKTYIRLEMLTDFEGRAVDPVDGAKVLPIGSKSVAFSDVLKFTTKVSTGVDAQLILTSVAGDLRLTNASIFGSAHRDDIHTVIVALASNPNEDLDKLPPEVRKRINTQRAEKGLPPLGPRVAFSARKAERMEVAKVVRDPRTATALIQKDADARTNVLLELQRLRDLEDDALEEPRRLGERLLKLLREPD